MNTALAVEGLAETVKGLKRASSTLPKAVSAAHREIVTRTVKPKALSNLMSQRSPKVPKKRGMIGHFATQREAGLILRARRYPWALGGEFGSFRFPQFKKWVGNRYISIVDLPGYIIGPAIEKSLPKVEAIYTRTVIRHIQEAIDD